MKFNFLFFACIVLLSIGLSNCNENSEKKPVEIDPGSIKEPLLKANKQVVGTEDTQIRNLIARYGWNMKETGTGLRYLVYKQGNGQQVQRERRVRINYEVRLITGDLVYSSKESGPKEFIVGSGGVESGLEEAILLFKVGDKAKLILPSHLAWGLIGDQDRIPPKSTLLYDIEVLEIK
jgi:FKBP-type peptidyl-prolyl cis-trans isomerase FkpA